MYKIFKVLPATFTVIEERTGFSSRTVSKLLTEMQEEIKLVKKFHNMYELIPYTPKEGEYWNPNLTEEEKFTFIVLRRIKTKMLLKMPGKKSKPIKTSSYELFEEFLKSESKTTRKT